MSQIVLGSRFLLIAAGELLKEAGFSVYGGSQPDPDENALTFDERDEDFCFCKHDEEDGDEVSFTLPKDWDALEKLLKNYTQRTEINEVTVCMPRVGEDCLFVIIDPNDDETRVLVTKEDFDQLKAFFDEDGTPLKLGKWSIFATEVQIGCTEGFNFEHLEEIEEFLEQHSK